MFAFSKCTCYGSRVVIYLMTTYADITLYTHRELDAEDESVLQRLERDRDLRYALLRHK